MIEDAQINRLLPQAENTLVNYKTLIFSELNQ